jgi:hypothetical protein
MVLHNTASQREAKAQFDTSRLVDLSENIIFDCPAAQVSDLFLMVLSHFVDIIVGRILYHLDFRPQCWWVSFITVFFV